MIRFLVGALEMERLGCGGTGHAQFLDGRLILPPEQEIEINHDFPPSHVRLGIITIDKIPTIL